MKKMLLALCCLCVFASVGNSQENFWSQDTFWSTPHEYASVSPVDQQDYLPITFMSDFATKSVQLETAASVSPIAKTVTKVGLIAWNPASQVQKATAPACTSCPSGTTEQTMQFAQTPVMVAQSPMVVAQAPTIMMDVPVTRTVVRSTSFVGTSLLGAGSCASGNCGSSSMSMSLSGSGAGSCASGNCGGGSGVGLVGRIFRR